MGILQLKEDPMSKHIVVGAGPVGSAVARLLADAGEQVCVVTRRGGPGSHPHIEHLAIDAADRAALVAASQGASRLYLCARPPHHQWPEAFPALLESVVHAAAGVAAKLVIVGDTCGYGDAAPNRLTEGLPLAPTTVNGRVRTAMWERAIASGVPATEVRASDPLGHGAVSLFTRLAVPGLLAGEPVSFPADLDAIHPWTFTEDVARTVVAASRHPAAWGRAFHAPSQHTSVRQLAMQLCHLAGAPAPVLARMSPGELQALAAQDAVVRAVVELLYLFERPWILDASETTRILGVRPTPLDAVLRDTLRSFAARA
jgi:nucleoside-diphosphate-sugar epimerase